MKEYKSVFLVTVILYCLIGGSAFSKERVDLKALPLSFSKINEVTQYAHPDDATELVKRLKQVVPPPSSKPGFVAAGAAVTLVTGYAVDALVKFLEAQADKHNASYSKKIFSSDLSRSLGAKTSMISIRRFSKEEGEPEVIASYAIFVIKKVSAGYLVHPVYVRIDDPKARVWAFGKKTRKATVTFDITAKYASDPLPTYNSGNATIASFTVKKVEIGKPYFFNQKEPGVLQSPDTIGFFAFPVNKVGSLSATVSETDESKAAKLLKKAATKISEKKEDILKVVAE